MLLVLTDYVHRYRAEKGSVDSTERIDKIGDVSRTAMTCIKVQDIEDVPEDGARDRVGENRRRLWWGWQVSEEDFWLDMRHENGGLAMGGKGGFGRNMQPGPMPSFDDFPLFGIG